MPAEVYGFLRAVFALHLGSSSWLFLGVRASAYLDSAPTSPERVSQISQGLRTALLSLGTAWQVWIVKTSVLWSNGMTRRPRPLHDSLRESRNGLPSWPILPIRLISCASAGCLSCAAQFDSVSRHGCSTLWPCCLPGTSSRSLSRTRGLWRLRCMPRSQAITNSTRSAEDCSTKDPKAHRSFLKRA